MIKVQFVKSTPENNYDDAVLILELSFPESNSKYDKIVDDSIYHYVLYFDSIYEFTQSDYDGPMIGILYLDENNKLLEEDDCMDYVYNL